MYFIIFALATVDVFFPQRCDILCDVGPVGLYLFMLFVCFVLGCVVEDIAGERKVTRC